MQFHGAATLHASTLLFLHLTSPAFAFGCPNPTESNPQHLWEVIIVGAGFAGVSAALTLSAQNVTNIRILEARDRIGGRSVTSFDLGTDVPIDIGSAWTHGRKKNPVRTLVNGVPHGIPRKSVAAFDCGGVEMSRDARKKTDRLRNDFESYCWRRQKDDETDTSLENVFRNFLEEKRIEEASCEHWRLRWVVEDEIVQDYGAALSELSLFWWDSNDYCRGNDAYLAVPGGGYGLVLDRFAEPVLSLVQLEARVTKIEYEEKEAVVSYVDTANDCNSGDVTQIRARHVVVTVPLGVLKKESIDFLPELPVSKHAAIQDLGMSLVNKCFLYWETMNASDIFWPKNSEWITSVPSNSKTVQFSGFFNAYKMNGQKPLLVAFLVGHNAVIAKNLTDEELVRAAVNSLRDIFGLEKVPEVTASVVTRWDTDPFSYGSYSYPRLGSTPLSRKHLAREISDRLWFAGEATHSRYPGTTHGALLSGEEVARKILKLKK